MLRPSTFYFQHKLRIVDKGKFTFSCIFNLRGLFSVYNLFFFSVFKFLKPRDWNEGSKKLCCLIKQAQIAVIF